MWKSIKWLPYIKNMPRFSWKQKTLSNSSGGNNKKYHFCPSSFDSIQYVPGNALQRKSPLTRNLCFMKPIWWRDPSALLNFRIYLRQPPPPKTRNYIASPTRFQYQGGKPLLCAHQWTDEWVFWQIFTCYKNVKPPRGSKPNI